MVRETTTLGQGQAPSKPQEMPTVRNVAVYESTRNIENVEFAFLAEKIQEHDNRHQFTRELQSVLSREFVNNMDNKYCKVSQSEVFYQCLVEWKARKDFGHAQVKDVAKMLQNCGMGELAEQIEP